jgi:hypothetical protein
MSTTLEPREAPPHSREVDVHSFEHHWQDEADAAYLYRLLAAAEPDPKKKDIYSRLADVEDRHVVVWSDLLTKHGHPPAAFRPSGRARLLATFGRWFGPSFLLPMLLEGKGAKSKRISTCIARRRVGRPVAPKRCSSLASLLITRRRWGKSQARVVSPGTRRRPVDFFATLCTASTTVSRQTSAW